MGFVISISEIVFALVLGFLALNGLTGFESNAQLLPLEEGKYSNSSFSFQNFEFGYKTFMGFRIF